ncbi:unnamed protein product [Caenorhabditis brenneri]
MDTIRMYDGTGNTTTHRSKCHRAFSNTTKNKRPTTRLSMRPNSTIASSVTKSDPDLDSHLYDAHAASLRRKEGVHQEAANQEGISSRHPEEPFRWFRGEQHCQGGKEAGSNDGSHAHHSTSELGKLVSEINRGMKMEE